MQNNLASNKKLNFLINLIFYAVCLCLFYLAIKYLLPLLIPFLIAFAISAILQRPIKFLTRKTILKKQKIWSAILVTFSFFALFFLFFIIGQELIRQAIGLLEQIPSFLSNTLPTIETAIEDTIKNISDKLPFNIELTSFGINKPDIITMGPQSLQEINAQLDSPFIIDLRNIFSSFDSSKIMDYLSPILKGSAGIVSGSSLFIISFIITIVSTYFLSSDYDVVIKFIKAQLPEKWKGVASHSKRFLSKSIYKLFKSYLTIILITFVELAIFLTIGGFEYPIALAALIAIIDILPVLGVGTVLIPWAIISIILGNWSNAIILIIAYVFITIVRQIIEPKIVGSSIGLHPILTLLSMYLGLQIFGFIGMFLLPIAIIFLKMLQENGYIHLWNDIEEPNQEEDKPSIVQTLYSKIINTIKGKKNNNK